MSDMDVVETTSVNTQKQETNGNGNGSGRMVEAVHRRMVDITRDKPIKLNIKVVVPVREHPKFNFVGKLLGPKGNSLKRLQEDTMTKMAILGRGSMRDRHKEEELRNSGDPKFSHLMEDLHVEVTAFASPAEAHARIAYALAEVRRFLVPDYNDEIRQEQLWEMQILNSGKTESSSDTSEGVAASPESSQESLSVEEPLPVSPELRQENSTTAAVTPTITRKRPFLQGGAARVSMSPTKRTVLSILARARAAQAKDIMLTPYQSLALPSNGKTVATISGVREESILTGENLILN